MKNALFGILLVLAAFRSAPARADFFGGDLPLLAGILANAVQQLTQLGSLLGTGKNTLGLLQDINRGINDALNLLNTIGPNTGSGVYGDLRDRDAALKRIQDLYGTPSATSDSTIQSNSDQAAAEAIAMNSSVYDYSSRMDSVGSGFQSAASNASPGRAAKLTAQALGVMVNLMNQSLRTQATGLKLQAQSLESENKKDKDMARQSQAAASDLKSAMQSDPVDFSTPRF